MSAPSIGTCFGFAMHSQLPFHYLRRGTGQPLEVSVAMSTDTEPAGDPIATWTATPALPWDGSLYGAEGGFRLWMADVGWFSIDLRGWSLTVPRADNPIRLEERLWSIPAMLCFMARGDLPVHAAAVDMMGVAVAIAAPRMSGKTTLAGAMVRSGFRLLSEDVTCVRPLGSPAIIPGPAMLRMRPDVAEWLDLPNAERISDADGRVHFALDPETRGDSDPVTLRGIFLLRQAESKPRVEAVPSAEAVRELWSQTSKLPTPEGRARCFEQLVDVVRTVPVWNLYRAFRAEDLPATVNLVAETVTESANRSSAAV